MTEELKLFRDLSHEEVIEFCKWAQDHYTPGTPINPLYHPVIVQECRRINEQACVKIHVLTPTED